MAGVSVGKVYYTVNVPFNLRTAQRRDMIAKLKAHDSGFYYKLMNRRNTEAQAKGVAETIKSVFGYDMEVSKTADVAIC